MHRFGVTSPQISALVNLVLGKREVIRTPLRFGPCAHIIPGPVLGGQVTGSNIDLNTTLSRTPVFMDPSLESGLMPARNPLLS